MTTKDKNETALATIPAETALIPAETPRLPLPEEEKRLAVLADMTKDMQVAAKAVDSKLASMAKGVVLSCWDIGAWVNQIKADKNRYGFEGIKQLVAYCPDANHSELCKCADVAKTYSRAELEAMVKRPMSNGGYLNVMHVRELRQIADGEDRQKITDRVFNESLTVDALHEVIRAGGFDTKNTGHPHGRKPSTPRSVWAAADQVAKQFRGIDNRFAVWEKHLLHELPQVSPKLVNRVLLSKVADAIKEVGDVKAKINNFLTELQSGSKRLVQVMETQAKADVAEAKDKKDKAEAKKKHKTPGAPGTKPASKKTAEV